MVREILIWIPRKPARLSMDASNLGDSTHLFTSWFKSRCVRRSQNPAIDRLLSATPQLGSHQTDPKL